MGGCVPRIRFSLVHKKGYPSDRNLIGEICALRSDRNNLKERLSDVPQTIVAYETGNQQAILDQKETEAAGAVLMAHLLWSPKSGAQPFR
jgi:hypothetical protein